MFVCRFQASRWSKPQREKLLCGLSTFIHWHQCSRFLQNALIHGFLNLWFQTLHIFAEPPKVTVINVASHFGKTRLDCLARGIPALYHFSRWEHKSMFGEPYSSISLFNYMVWDQQTNILHELTFYSKNIFSHLYHTTITIWNTVTNMAHI
jgi:hypothetical protein